MILRPLRSRFRALTASGSLHPDVSRGIRDTVAVTVPLIGAFQGWLPFSTPFVAFAAQTVAIQDVRGPYTLRLAVLLTMTLVLVGAAQLGQLCNTSIGAAMAGALAIALLGGLWRHILPDYGTPLAISSTLLFLLSASMPSASGIESHALGALVGGSWSVFLQIAYWPIRPQHPLRRAVADSWVAVADLFEALSITDAHERRAQVHERETTLRTTLDQAYSALAARPNRQTTSLHELLAELNLAAARLATRVVALDSALESLTRDPGAAWFTHALQPVLTALTNTSRSIAVTLVSRRASHLALCEVRSDRLANLLELFASETAPRLADDGTAAQTRELLRQITTFLPPTLEALRATVDPEEERTAFSLELFDLHTWTLRPLASALVFRRHVDRVLIRFTARVAAVTVGGVACFKFAQLPHGYWLPLTAVLVMQPDYGATRQRAIQRALGTLAGSIAATGLLWLAPPRGALLLATSATIFGFAFYLKRNYTRAVFFVTLMVVLLTEAQMPVTVAFTLERLGNTVAGALLAIIASHYFWPVWERDRVDAILANALTANRRYAHIIAARFAAASAYDAEVIAAKRRAESANAAAFHSLQRLRADPARHQSRVQQAAALANGNQRVTRALTLLALQLAPGEPVRLTALPRFFEALDRLLDGYAAELTRGTISAEVEAESDVVRTLIARPADTLPRDGSVPRAQAVVGLLPRLATELGAIRVAIRHGAGADPTLPER